MRSHWHLTKFTNCVISTIFACILFKHPKWTDRDKNCGEINRQTAINVDDNRYMEEIIHNDETSNPLYFVDIHTLTNKHVSWTQLQLTRLLYTVIQALTHAHMSINRPSLYYDNTENVYNKVKVMLLTFYVFECCHCDIGAISNNDQIGWGISCWVLWILSKFVIIEC